MDLSMHILQHFPMESFRDNQYFYYVKIQQHLARQLYLLLCEVLLLVQKLFVQFLFQFFDYFLFKSGDI